MRHPKSKKVKIPHIPAKPRGASPRYVDCQGYCVIKLNRKYSRIERSTRKWAFRTKLTKNW